ncbi:hypothetical protein ACYOEI_27740, partial [Singulisphaera rosea]
PANARATSTTRAGAFHPQGLPVEARVMPVLSRREQFRSPSRPCESGVHDRPQYKSARPDSQGMTPLGSRRARQDGP